MLVTGGPNVAHVLSFLADELAVLNTVQNRLITVLSINELMLLVRRSLNVTGKVLAGSLLIDC